ncbi:hypothetical protein [Myxococcus sp. AM010]|uniref:hypothetical protein n=1 Tax=Myxococcus sp. AM010 TaxID=2745138 RepID=UPI0015956078|nr:hypothetical protein [Myxococcus sp. AM010]NVJ13315.1 hypothetical protein [Myxococcus sp. AM010]
MSKTFTLYRPIGLKEAELILDSDCSAFPPRLPDQPIFYPVMNAEYARQIARDRDTPDAGSGHASSVTAFDVDTAYASRFPVRFTDAWYGPEYRGPDTTLGPLERQILALFKQGHNALPLLQANTAACLFNAAWWSTTPPSAQGLDTANHLHLLDRLRQTWVALHPTWPLPSLGGIRQTGTQ